MSTDDHRNGLNVDGFPLPPPPPVGVKATPQAAAGPVQSAWLPVCASADLVDAGLGRLFDVQLADGKGQGFAVRFEGRVYAYVNRCAHVPTELDWNPGEFFDVDGRVLVCATHGAEYQPTTGRCTAGPCRGKALRAITVREQDGQVQWQPDTWVRVLP